MARAVGLVQEKVLSQFIDERFTALIKAATERLVDKVRAFNGRPLGIDPSLTRRSAFEGRGKVFLKKISAITWGEDIKVKGLKVQKGG